MLRVVATALLVIGLLLAVIFSPQVGNSALFTRALHNFAHAPIFGSVAVALLFGFRAHERFVTQPVVRQYAIIFVLTMGLGLVTEAAQLVTGRDASWADLRTDGLGAAAFLLALGAFDPARVRASWGERTFLLLFALGAFALAAAPVARTALAYWHRAQVFPAIADFRRDSAAVFVFTRAAHADIVPVPEKWAGEAGERALRVHFLGEQWPSVELAELVPNWRRYRRLSLEIINPQSAEIVLSVRIDDRQHNKRFEDRYNGRFVLPPSARTVIRIPLEEIEAAPRDRKLDLEHIARLLLFKDASPGETIYVVGVRLE